MNRKYEVTLPELPEGYEIDETGMRRAWHGEYYLHIDGRWVQHAGSEPTYGRYICARKREPTAADVVCALGNLAVFCIGSSGPCVTCNGRLYTPDGSYGLDRDNIESTILADKPASYIKVLRLGVRE